MNSLTFLFTKQPRGHVHTPQIIQLSGHLTENEAKGQRTARWSTLRDFPQFRETIQQKPTLTCYSLTKTLSWNHLDARFQWKIPRMRWFCVQHFATCFCKLQLFYCWSQNSLSLWNTYVAKIKHIKNQVFQMCQLQKSMMDTAKGRNGVFYQTPVAFQPPYSHKNNFNEVF